MFPMFTGFQTKTLLGILLTPTNLLTATFRATTLGFSVPNNHRRIMWDVVLAQDVSAVSLAPVVPETPVIVTAPPTLLMAVSYVRINAGAHSNQGYNAMHANALDMRPPTATCLPSCCSLIITQAMKCRTLNAMPSTPSG